jgi:hypothetical protein
VKRKLSTAATAVLAALCCLPVGRDARRAQLLVESARVRRVATPDARRCGPLPCAWQRQLMRPEQAPPLGERDLLHAGSVRGLGEAELVVGLAAGVRAVAYPLNLLRYHRAINDRAPDGRALAVLHSPLSGATLCLDRSSLGELRHSGLGLEGDELIRDGQGALWSPLLGGRLDGRESSRRLECTVMRWSAWQKLQPRTRVAWPRRTVLGFDYRRDPWAWYRRDRRYLVAPVHFLDLRLPEKQEVLGLRAGGQARAFALPASGRRVVNATVGGQPVLVLLDAPSGVAQAFDRRLGGRELELGADLRDRGGTRFDLQGRAVSGPLAGRELRRLPAQRALYFAWAAITREKITIDDDVLSRRDDHVE